MNLKYLNYFDKKNNSSPEINELLELDKEISNNFIKHIRNLIFEEFSKDGKEDSYTIELIKRFFYQRYNIWLYVDLDVDVDKKSIILYVYDYYICANNMSSIDYIASMEFNKRFMFDMLDIAVASHSYKINHDEHESHNDDHGYFGYKPYTKYRYYDYKTKKPIFLNNELIDHNNDFKKFLEFNNKKYSRIIDLWQLYGESAEEHFFILDGFQYKVDFNNNKLLIDIKVGSYYDIEKRELIRIDETHPVLLKEKNKLDKKGEQISTHLVQNGLGYDDKFINIFKSNVWILFSPKEANFFTYNIVNNDDNKKYNIDEWNKHHSYLKFDVLMYTFDKRKCCIKKLFEMPNKETKNYCLTKTLDDLLELDKKEKTNRIKYFSFKKL